jgi:glycosyltransferase involved in cell wall biosynthesis
MRVLIFSQYFTPEVTASRVRVHAFAQGLAERGHEIEVICEVPNHPGGVVYPGYGGARLVDRRRLDRFDVAYVRVRTSPEKSTRNRLLLYGTYAASATAVGIAAKRPDVILASSPPLPVAAAAAAVAKRHRVPWVFDVRDLWPEAAVVLGELRGKRAIAAAERLERRLYRSAATIVTVTAPFKDAIAAHVDASKIHLLANGTTRMWIEAGEAEPDRGSAGFDDDAFTWMYAGNFGIAQGLSTAVEAASRLGEGFRLVLLGGGPERQRLARAAAQSGPGRVELREPVQPAEAALQMRAADALLVSLDAQPELAKFVPSKLFDCCALGRPVILAASGEAPRLAAEADAALVVAPADPDALAGAVRRLRDEPALASRLSDAGRAFAAHHLREDQIGNLERILGDAVASAASSR